ncbi:MAG TPA: SDR family oxidoreductase [Rhizomicrobium sp.]|jgi:NAD(P)-dependent dehydrogenase (short-subunit alcohol dehydrogenase family)|nr:SDR family oxidoreductase [Rhizomicrobium sp.]HWY64193.1 SDR family oxidoreductase [Rhizomicrobium sp.]
MKQALITGGARGIGFGIAEAMLAAGYKVTVTGLTREEVAAVPRRDNLSAVTLDVTDDAAVAACIAGLPRMDALVNCAGMVLRDGQEFTISGFQKVIDVNLTGTMRMCLAAKPLLDRSGGAIVNIASVWSFFGGPLVPAYTASKGGVAQLTKALAVAWAPAIRVNAIAPGWIETDLTKAAQADKARSDAIVSRTPFGRWGQPDDIGGAAVFLCSEAAGFITGTVLPVDGGYTAK